MEEITKIKNSIIRKVYEKPESSGLAYRTHGKSENIHDYSEREINEMVLGIYRDKKYLLSDDDLFINLSHIIKAECVLQNVTYYKKPSLESRKNNSCNIITNIRTFYIKDYFLISKDPIHGITRHKITRYLHKIGFLNRGRGKYYESYRISNNYKSLITENIPKDLYHPIKRYINGLFFNDDYKISEFELISSIKFTSE